MINNVLEEASKYGDLTIRRIYGDWTNQQLVSWKPKLHVHAIQPVQQFGYTVGKNSTDSALIIDAMDLLHQGVATAFAIVSSDSDFTRLATRIRESGKFVLGIGEKKTPKPFVKACNQFVYTENLKTPKKTVKKPPEEEDEVGSDPLTLLLKAFEMNEKEDGTARLSSIGSTLVKLDPAFDSRTYGFTRLGSLVTSYSKEFKIVGRGSGIRVQRADR